MARRRRAASSALWMLPFSLCIGSLSHTGVRSAVNQEMRKDMDFASLTMAVVHSRVT